jgi:hypothetical protein
MDTNIKDVTNTRQERASLTRGWAGIATCDRKSGSARSWCFWNGTKTQGDNMKSLYQLTSDWMALTDLLESFEGGEIPPEADAFVTQWMASLGSEEGAKLDGCVAYLKTLAMEEVAARAEMEQWAKRARVRANRQDWLKKRLKEYLELTHRTKAETASGVTLAIQKNGGKQPLVMAESLDPDKIPDRLAVVRREPNKEAIYAALEAGEKLEFAALAERGTHLRIRI